MAGGNISLMMQLKRLDRLELTATCDYCIRTEQNRSMLDFAVRIIFTVDMNVTRREAILVWFLRTVFSLFHLPACFFIFRTYVLVLCSRCFINQFAKSVLK